MKMGGKDVIYLKQQHSSTLQPADVQKKLKEMADKRFLDANGQYSSASDQVFPNEKVCEISFSFSGYVKNPNIENHYYSFFFHISVCDVYFYRL